VSEAELGKTDELSRGPRRKSLMQGVNRKLVLRSARGNITLNTRCKNLIDYRENCGIAKKWMKSLEIEDFQQRKNMTFFFIYKIKIS